MSSAASAAGAAGFAIGMTGGRFLSVPLTWFGSLRPQYHLITLTTGFLLMWLVPNPVTAITGLGLAGIGISLMYPTGINRLMRRFPESVERGSARGGLASGTALLSAPAVLGGLRGLSNVRTAYLAVPALVVALLLTYRWCDRTERRVFGRR
jgi:MFS family permease